jgi:hypothetical protein
MDFWMILRMLQGDLFRWFEVKVSEEGKGEQREREEGIKTSWSHLQSAAFQQSPSAPPFAWKSLDWGEEGHEL